ncbi:MAG: respiratory chain complex I subunit 1 family protein [Verrucomicrobiia bacterium]
MNASILKPLFSFLTPLLLAPFLIGIINRVKAKFAGRKGQPLLQPYYDIIKLLNKGAVYSATTSWIFRAGTMINLATVLCALLIVPCGPFPSLISFEGDIFLLVYLIGLARFITVISALDTGSSFEGMGASREVFFSALAEPTLLLGLLALSKLTNTFSLTSIIGNLSPEMWYYNSAYFALITGALFIVLLSENARIPVDDPNTHLELTMIHEVMVLDHSGPDFASINYVSALRLWINSAIIAPVLLPVNSGNIAADFLVWLSGVFLISIVVGVIESSMARLRLTVVPQFLLGATALAITALVLTWIR